MRKRSWAVAAAAASIGMALPVSAASYVAEGSASLTGLSYRLIDLDPTDGIAPWLRIDSQSSMAIGNVLNSGDPTVVSVSGHPFSGAVGSVRSEDGSAQAAITPSVISAATWLSDDNFSVGTESVHRLAGVEFPYIYDEQGDLVGDWFALSLSPQTALIIEGQAVVSASVDTRILSGTPFMGSLVDEQAYLDVGQWSSVTLILTGGSPWEAPETFSSVYDRYATASVSAWAVAEGTDFGSDMYSDSQALAIGYYNGSADTIGLALDVGVRSETSAYRFARWTPPPVDPGTPPAVPEASTQALMLLGLGGLVMAVRRRR